uniref:Uncharacterized protein n=1 Tax=Melopsittacus undulatus TaxID=13146 RepID=A0A8V5FJL6_MELUD
MTAITSMVLFCSSVSLSLETGPLISVVTHALLLKWGILFPLSVSITFGKFHPSKRYGSCGFQESVVCQVGPLVIPMSSILLLVTCASWSGYNNSQSTREVLLAVCFPLQLHLSVLFWYPNASGISLPLRKGLNLHTPGFQAERFLSEHG